MQTGEKKEDKNGCPIQASKQRERNGQQHKDKIILKLWNRRFVLGFLNRPNTTALLTGCKTPTYLIGFLKGGGKKKREVESSNVTKAGNA